MPFRLTFVPGVAYVVLALQGVLQVPPPGGGVGVGTGVGVGVATGVGVGVGLPLTGVHNAGTLGGSQPTCEVWAWMHLYSTFWYITNAPTAYAVFGAQLGTVCANDARDTKQRRTVPLKIILEIFFIDRAPSLVRPVAGNWGPWVWSDRKCRGDLFFPSRL
jgi:hypothetical protein